MCQLNSSCFINCVLVCIVPSYGTYLVAILIVLLWREALKRVWSLPRLIHSIILYSLCNKWPIEEEIYRRSLLFGI